MKLARPKLNMQVPNGTCKSRMELANPKWNLQILNGTCKSQIELASPEWNLQVLNGKGENQECSKTFNRFCPTWTKPNPHGRWIKNPWNFIFLYKLAIPDLHPSPHRFIFPRWLGTFALQIWCYLCSHLSETGSVLVPAHPFMPQCKSVQSCTLKPVCDQGLATNWFQSAAVYTCTLIVQSVLLNSTPAEMY